MNTTASSLLRALATVGVRSVRFRVLSQYDANKHTTPIAMLDEDDGTGHRMPRFSIPDLFNAYALMPRKGYYTLEVDQGQLSFEPTSARSAADTSKKRWKPKVTRRRTRAKSTRLRKFPSA